jgi:hypothetical protein
MIWGLIYFVNPTNALLQMSKYITLLNILDQLRAEAPREFKSYYPVSTDKQGLDHARGKAFIHLFLKVRYGLLEFGEREFFVTDDPDDGGIDAYYIDEETKTIFLIQSKFRTNEKNFEEKHIEIREILKMDADRIADGKVEDEDGKNIMGRFKGCLMNSRKSPTRLDISGKLFFLRT